VVLPAVLLPAVPVPELPPLPEVVLPEVVLLAGPELLEEVAVAPPPAPLLSEADEKPQAAAAMPAVQYRKGARKVDQGRSNPRAVTMRPPTPDSTGEE
jgi:hypothetical protein